MHTRRGKRVLSATISASENGGRAWRVIDDRRVARHHDPIPDRKNIKVIDDSKRARADHGVNKGFEHGEPRAGTAVMRGEELSELGGICTDHGRSHFFWGSRVSQRRAQRAPWHISQSRAPLGNFFLTPA